ncbi:MAG: translation initiation factor IF-2 N-terminal domain-containing protein, partial [Acidobacteria bacterium]|nr:translation initiation factor IF-2 N-terminal domain-containing protein [Acidobacteriota bacterium]
MMGIANQDLVFKLKSIGVRVEGDDAHIDTDIISAILQGKKLPHPREVILRDEPAAPESPATARRRVPAAPPVRRPAANPLRPNRPRTLIQKVEPRIQTLPASERPAPLGAPGSLYPGTPGLGGPGGFGAQAAGAGLAGAAGLIHHVQGAGAAVHDSHAAHTAAPATIVHAPHVGAAGAHGAHAAHGADVAAHAPHPASPGHAAPGAAASPGSRPPYGGAAHHAAPGHAPAGRPAGGAHAPAGYGGAEHPSRTVHAGSAAAGGVSGAAAGRLSPLGVRPGGPAHTAAAGHPGASAGPRPAPAGPADAGEAGRRRGERVIETPPKQDKNKKKAKGVKKPGLRSAEEEDLSAYKGTIEEDIDSVEEAADATGGRRRRRALRKEDEGGKILTFKKAPPQGTVMIGEGMTLREFAEKLGVKARDLIKALFDRGILANINQVIEPELAQQLAQDLGVDTMVVSFEEEVQLNEELAGGQAGEGAPGAAGASAVEGKVPRAPVVTIMGHVDHGKTSLLDAIRSSKVTESEFGGITQHIGAYHVDVHGRQVVFLDTPGHEAFTMMRARGARVTDIVVLVVAADDGVMPQTIEAIDHARAARVPIVVAINKIDKPNANTDRVKRELSERGLMAEDWGGDTVMVPVSALKKQGIQELLEMILLTADILELKSSPDIQAQGAVLEA